LSEWFIDGLMISLKGLGVTFAALGLLILTMVLLTRLFPARRETEEVASARPPVTPDISEPGAEEDEVIAAIGLALAHLRPPRIGGSGPG